MLIVRELSLGPKRFGELEERLPGLGTNLLSARLKTLEKTGVVRRAVLPAPARVPVYELGERGRRLEPILDELALWGYELLRPEPGERHARASWIALSMRAAGRGEPRDIADGVLVATVAGEQLVLTTRRGHLDVRHGVAELEPDVKISTDLPTFFALVSGGLTASAARRERRAEIEGDTRYLSAVLRAYALPSRG